MGSRARREGGVHLKAFWILAAALILVPVAAADAHLPAPTGLRVDPGNQVLHIAWDAAGTGTYRVRVYDGDSLVQEMNRTTAEATFRGVNGRTYGVTVALVDAAGEAGPESARVFGTPALAEDRLFLAAGLAVVAAGLLAYHLWLARLEARMRRKASSSGDLAQREPQ